MTGQARSIAGTIASAMLIFAIKFSVRCVLGSRSNAVYNDDLIYSDLYSIYSINIIFNQIHDCDKSVIHSATSQVSLRKAHVLI